MLKNHFFTISDDISGKQHGWGNSNSSFTTYSNYQFSLQYPKSWELIGKVDDITDIFIGDANGKIGLSIMCIETNKNLSELVAETNKNLTSNNIHILSEMEMTLCNVPCHVRKYKFTTGKEVVFQEEYLLKKGYTMYSVKFGNNEKTIKDNKILIRKIIKSLIIKHQIYKRL